MPVDGGDPGDSLGPVTYRPGAGLALVGARVVVFLPEPMDHPLLDEIASRLADGTPGAAAAISRSVLAADLDSLPPFAMVEREATGWHLVARGAVQIELIDDGAASRLDASGFDVVLEHRTSASVRGVRIGSPPAHGLFVLGGPGVVPADGLSIGVSTPDGVWSQGRDVLRHPFDRASLGAGAAPLPETERDLVDDAPFDDAPFDDAPFDGLSLEDSPFEDSPFEDSSFDDLSSDEESSYGDDSSFEGGPVGAVADLFGVSHVAVPAADPSTETDTSSSDIVGAPEPDPTVAHAHPSDLPSDSPSPDPVESPNSTSMLGKTEIDRLREQLRADMAGAGKSTTHVSASLVRGRTCPNGHLNEFTDPTCRQCGDPIPFDAVTTTGPRPRLGRLEFDNGQVVNLDRPVAIGRNPPVDHVVGGETANPVTVTDIDMRISSFHVKVYFEGWNVVAENPGSTNATWVSLPSGQRTELRRGQPMVIRPGSTVTMADRRSFTYLVP